MHFRENDDKSLYRNLGKVGIVNVIFAFTLVAVVVNLVFSIYRMDVHSLCGWMTAFGSSVTSCCYWNAIQKLQQSIKDQRTVV